MNAADARMINAILDALGGSMDEYREAVNAWLAAGRPRVEVTPTTTEIANLRARLRTTAQILITETGSDGPRDAEVVASEAVQLIKNLRAGLATANGRARSILSAAEAANVICGICTGEDCIGCSRADYVAQAIRRAYLGTEKASEARPAVMPNRGSAAPRGNLIFHGDALPENRREIIKQRVEHPEPKEPAGDTVLRLPFPSCPVCGKELRMVIQSSNSSLNHEQWMSQRAGDWFCECCKGDRGKDGYRYYWNHELPRRVRCPHVDTGRCTAHHSEGMPDCPPGSDEECTVPYATSERGEAWIMICGLPEVEYQIAKRIIERLAMGLRQYGPWPADDRRDMREEAMQEVLDAAIYSARALTRGEIPDDDKRGCEGCP